MRKIVQRMFAILLLLLPLSSLGLRAQIVAGGVYNLVNLENGQSINAPSLNVVASAVTNLKDYSQLWYAESATDNSGRFALRNLSNGLYLRSSRKASAPWTLVPQMDENCYLYSVSVGNSFVINSENHTQGYNCMHFDTGQGRVVCWAYDNAKKSTWDISSVSISSSELDANWREIAEFGEASKNAEKYQAALSALFVDKACTVLKNPGENFSNNNDFLQLSPTLQQMVLKIQKQDWTEKNENPSKKDWASDYAKKFRVQLYEPYSDPRASSEALKINFHSNLNNPTGLYANRQVIYLMVEGAIKEGATLYLASVVGHSLPDGNSQSGIQLHEGLNVVTYWSDGNALHVNYVVETFKGGKMTQHKLSQYDPIKIHVEGGYINGYFNAVGDELYKVDTNEDWQYYEDRANLDDIIILGKYQTIQFYLNDTEGSHGLAHYFPEADVNAVMAEWDRIMMSERLNMGLLSKKEVDEANRLYPTLDDRSRGIYAFIGGEENGFYKDYSDSYRLHGLSFGTTHGYMYGSNEYSGYNVNTFGDIIGNITKAAGPTWGPAHEIGHQHQLLLNMNGLTEVSNNIFSNIAVWYNGRSTSRINVDGGDLMSILNVFNQENTDFFTNDRWALTQMNYKLWLYYHLAGHNNKFYPRLFEILRNDPMQISSTQDGATSLLHLYKKCCLAAGEDLTDFFRAYGVFRPMDNRFVDDYTKSHYTMTQAQIDAAIQEVKSWNLPENHVLMLINDATADKTFGHDGKTQRDLWSGVCSDLGNYITFYVGKESKVTTPYVCNMEGKTVHMSEGKGGVGFLIYDLNGELLGFSDHYKFPISAHAQLALAKGKAKLYVANGDNSLVEVKIQNAEANERKMLNDLLIQSENIFKLEDASEKMVGFYRPESLADLKIVYNEAKKVADADVKGTFIAAYEMLNEALTNVYNDKYSKIGVIPGSTYAFVNRQYTSKWMSIGSGKEMKAVNVNGAVADTEKWYLESSGGDGVYAIKSKSTGTYVKDVKQSRQMIADNTEASISYKLKNMGDGYFALICQDHEGLALHCDAASNIVGWYDYENPSQWRIQAMDLSEVDAAKVKLENLVEQTDDLLGKMAVISGEVKLQTTEVNVPGYLYCNAPYTGNNNDRSTPENGYNLLDNNPSTHLHTDYSGVDSKDHLDHYLRVDLGEGQSLSEFVLRYETRDSNTPERPKTMVVAGSNDNVNYEQITTLTNLPNSQLAKVEKSIKAAKAYRYLRFMVTDTYGGGEKKGHKFFSMASFGIGYGEDKVFVSEQQYENCLVQIETAYSEVKAARKVLAAHKDVAAFNAAISTLQNAYSALSTAYKDANNGGLNSKKAELKALIDQVTALYNECGTVVETASGVVALQVTDEAASGYLFSNADQNTGGGNSDGAGIVGLCDGDPNTYFHSRWGGTEVAEPHFLQVDLGEDKLAGSFRFSYAVRQNAEPANNSPAPTEITIMGSNDGQTFSPVTMVNSEKNGLPAYSDLKKWESDAIVMDNAYRYLRFAVTKSVGPASSQYAGQYFFAMSEFNLELQPTTSAIVNPNHDAVTKEQLIETYRGINSAKIVFDSGKNISQFDEAIADLNVLYQSLEVARDASVAYIQLRDYFIGDNLLEGQLKGGDKIGCYPVELAQNYNQAYAQAQSLVTEKNGDANSYTAAYNSLKAAFEGLQMNVPEVGKLYVLRSAHSGYAKDHLAYVNADNKMQHSAEVSNTQTRAIWTFNPTEDGKFVMRSLHTGDGVKAFTSNSVTPLSADAQPLSIEALDGLGQVALVTNGEKMHAQKFNNAIVAWPGNAGSASAWLIEEVDPSVVNYEVSVSKYEYAGLYLDFNAVIPAGVTAYVATNVGTSSVSLAPLSGNVLPARTAVIIKAAPGKYSFSYTAEEAAPVASKLHGSAYTQYLHGEPNMSYYVFGVKTIDNAEKVGLYKAWLEYDANGSQGENDVLNDTDNGGYFKVSANKIYLPEVSTSAPSLFFIFEDITGIDHVESDLQKAEIYDLQGRRVNEVQKSGLYIVNGQKRFVNK